MQNLLKQAQKLQEDAQKAQEELQSMVFTATAGGGAVRVEIGGDFKVLAIQIDPGIVDPDDIDFLGDTITAAVNAAIKMVEDESSRIMGSVSGGLTIPGL
jgi:DNA-binding YbaB/EbfC family protein